MRSQKARRRGGGLSCDRRLVGIETHDPGAVGGQPLEQGRVRDQHRRSGILEHVGQTIARVTGIEGQIGAARFEDAEQRDHHFGRALRAQPDHHLGSDGE